MKENATLSNTVKKLKRDVAKVIFSCLILNFLVNLFFLEVKFFFQIVIWLKLRILMLNLLWSATVDF